jgi:glycosyltransferase involved in cell wall biosynthesis
VNILWLTWKDHLHPDAGGAEVVLRELTERLVAEGHQVTWLTCGYAGAASDEIINGVRIIRVGMSRYSHPLRALWHYVSRLQRDFDIVVEVVNTAPYFSVFFNRAKQRFLFYHQLAREVWQYETRPPLSIIGEKILEPVFTRLLGSVDIPTITISGSTKADLVRFGFKPDNIHIISEGIEIEPVAKLSTIKKYPQPTLLSFGSMRAMKRTLDQIEAFELAKPSVPGLQLKIAGSASGEYGQRVLARIADSPYARDIHYLGRVSKRQKIQLMQRSHVTLQTSLKEGWGLTITEAASQGTPAIVYDVDGLRDSVRHQRTGLITTPKPSAMATAISQLLTDRKLYDRLRDAAWRWSQEITFDQCYQDFKQVVRL